MQEIAVQPISINYWKQFQANKTLQKFASFLLFQPMKIGIKEKYFFS